MDVVEYCPACAGSHRAGERPALCHHVLLLADGLRNYLTADDEQEAADDLLSICHEVLGEESDPDEEVFA